MHRNRPFQTLSLLLAGVALGLLSACAPPPAGSTSQLQAELTRLTRLQQRQGDELTLLRQQLAQLQQSLDERPLQPQATVGATPAADQPQTAAADPSTAELSTPAPEAAEVAELARSASLYLEAFSALAAGQHGEAREGFAHFLDAFPEHQYAPNARYWLAEAQATLGEFKSAIENLRRLIEEPAGQHKTPAALLRLAQLYQQQNLSAQAEDILEQLRRDYPDSSEARLLNRSDEPQ